MMENIEKSEEFLCDTYLNQLSDDSKNELIRALFLSLDLTVNKLSIRTYQLQQLDKQFFQYRKHIEIGIIKAKNSLA